MNKTLGLAIIAKNEGHRIAHCLNSARPYVNKIVVVDTGSTDNTIAVAESCGATVYKSEYFNSDTKIEDFDFAAARNESFDKLDTDYILWLDCDDYLPPDSGQFIKEMMQHDIDDDIIMINYHYAFDANNKPVATFPRERIIKKGLKWKYPIHECISLERGKCMMWNGPVIEHHRGAPDPLKLYTRNITILEKYLAKEPDEPRLLYYTAKEHFDYQAYDKAYPILQRHIDIDNDMELVSCSLIRLAIYYSINNQIDKQVASLYEAILKCPHRIEAYLSLSDYYSNHEPRLAIKWAHQAAELKMQSVQPDYPQLYEFGANKRLAILYDKIGKKDKAKHYRRLWLSKDLNNVSLHIGCGSQSYKKYGYRDCDVVDLDHVDHIFSMESPPFPDNIVERIISEHSLEHIPRELSLKALKEWHRILKPGGEFILKIPDLEECCRQYLNAVESDNVILQEWYHKTIYGAQTPENGVPADYQFHKTGYNEKQLKTILEKLGYSIDCMAKYVDYDTPSLYTRAIKHIVPWSIHWYTDPMSTWGPHRIRIKNMNRALNSIGFKTKLSRDKSDIAIITHPESLKDYELARKNAKIVIFEFFEDTTTINNTIQQVLSKVDATICCSQKMAEIASRYCKQNFIIEDMVETREDIQCSYEEKKQLTFVWCGYEGHAYKAEEKRELIESMGHKLILIHEGKNADIIWNEQTWMHDIAKCDIAIATTDNEKHPAKSHTRIVAPMALGLPVIAWPRDSFESIIRNKENGFMVHNDEEFKLAIKMLELVEIRKKIGQAGCKDVQNFRFQPMANKYAQALNIIVSQFSSAPVNQNKITDIIIPNYKNLDYLKCTIDSVRANTEKGTYRLIIVDGSSDEEIKQWIQSQSDVISIFDNKMTFAEATNKGIELSLQNDNDICLLNNDVIVRPDWLKKLHKHLSSEHVAIGPFSNCDLIWRHKEIAMTGNVQWTVNRNLEELTELDLDSLFYGPIINKPTNNEEVEWLPFYCTLIKKDIIRKVGLLNTNFRNGGEDFDYCKKIGELGYKMMISRESEVWHFGGKTRKIASGEMGDQYKIEDKANNSLQNKLWNDPKRIVIYCGEGYEPWSPLSIDNGGIGGSETAVIYMAKEFQAQGYLVTVLAESEGVFDNVIYRHHSSLKEVISKGVDIFISSRRIDIIDDYIRVMSRKILVWVHDVWLHHQPGQIDQHKWDMVDHFMVLSPWHKQFFIEHHKIKDVNKVELTRNGINFERFNQNVSRIPGKIIYTSSLDRGYLTTIQYMPEIIKQIPDAKLHIYYGLDNWKKMAELHNNQQLKNHIQLIESTFKYDYIEYHGRIGQKELAKEMMSAQVLAYAGWWSETYCISAIEAMAAGCPIVASNLAGLQTTIGNKGILIGDKDDIPKFNGDLGSQIYQRQFIDSICNLLSDKDLWNKYSVNGQQHACNLAWGDVAEQWIKLTE